MLLSSYSTMLASPNYFDPMSASGVRYSFTGAITQPRQVLRGGYLSCKDFAMVTRRRSRAAVF
jgi:hypothetical protein